MKFALAATVTIFFLFTTSTAFSDAAGIAPEFESQIDMLNEISERRRVNTFFINEQSIFNGVQKGFVNVGKGNLTFIRRDLVTVGRLPVVFARVFDSAFTGDSDFSPGWRISIAETIRINSDGSLSYTDDGLSVSHFSSTNGAFTASPAHPSDVKTLVATSDGFLVTLRNQWTKRFILLGDVARLVEVSDNNGNTLNLTYGPQHQLANITGQNGRFISIFRNTMGQVIEIIDDQSRSVSYSYNNKGELAVVTDLGGNDWTYKYANGQLHQVVDPKGNRAALISYHQDGRVKHTQIRQKQHSYDYNGSETTVTDEMGDSSQFVQNALGVTTHIVNSEDFASEIDLTPTNNVAALRHNGRLRATFSYDSSGNPERLVRFDAEGEVELTYLVDWNDRVVAIAGTDGNTQSLNYDTRGNLISRTHNDSTVHFEFNEQGDLISQIDDGETTTYEYSEDGLLEQWENIDGISQFTYNAQGRLAAVTFPDGTQHQYQYDPLGFRTATTRADGSWQDFEYDSTGNLTEFQSINLDGEPYGQKLILNKENQVSRIEFQPQGQLDIRYNADGNPKSLAWGDDAMSCEYDSSGRLISIQSDMSGTRNYQYTDGEADIRKQLDDRTFPSLVNHRRASDTFGSLSEIHYVRSHGSFGTVVNWNEELSILDLPTEIGLVYPDSLLQAADQRRRLYNTLAQDPILQRAFDKASNSFFLPPEYASANCVFTSTAIPTLSVPTTAFTGVTVSITGSVAWKSAGCGPVKFWFTANGSYIGQGTGALSKTISTVFSSAGTITITVRVMCSYGDSSIEYASADVSVEALITQNITVARHDEVSFTTTQFDTQTSGGSTALQVKNSSTDIVCPVKLQRSGSIATFGGTSTFDFRVVDTEDEFYALEGHVPQLVKIVDQIEWCGYDGLFDGCTIPGNIVMDDTLPAMTVAHEFGHHKGLSGDPNPTRIMHDQPVAGRNEVTAAQCNAFKN